MDNNSLKRFGEYIKLLRETEGMSQEELAKKSGFAGRAAISALEKGKTNISVDRLQDLATPHLHQRKPLNHKGFAVFSFSLGQIMVKCYNKTIFLTGIGLHRLASVSLSGGF